MEIREILEIPEILEIGQFLTDFNSPLFWALLCYWAYCLIFGTLQGGFPLVTQAKARDYFIAGGALNWWFIAAATATSFAGWAFLTHPYVIYEYGFSAAYASLCAITIPLAGVFFFKRQWLLGRRCGFVTPGEMFYAYFKSDIIRYLVLVVAVLFTLFYLAVLLRAAGYLFYILTDGQLSIKAGIILLAIVLVIYVTIGGLRTVAYLSIMQVILFASGMIALGWLVLHYVGGWPAFSQGMERLANFHQYFHGNPQHFMIPSLFDWSKQAALANTGSYWTATFIVTFLLAFMGLQSSPAFSMWVFATKEANAFGRQQVWASSLGIGFIMITLTTIIGIGSHFLGADYALRENSTTIAAQNILGSFLNDRDLLSNESAGQPLLVPLLIRLTLDISPLLIAILAIAALVAIQSTAAAYMSTIGSMLSRDLLKNGLLAPKTARPKANAIVWGFTILIIMLIPISSLPKFDPILLISGLSMLIPILIAYLVYSMTSQFNDHWQKWAAAMFTLIITISAGRLAMVTNDTLIFMGALAIAYGGQMMPALLAICWRPFFTAFGIKIGLITGLSVVTVTEFGHQLFWVPWGPWPLTIHSAIWGLSANLVIASVISLLQTDKNRSHREKFHRFLNDPLLQHTQTPAKKPKPSSLMTLLIVTIVLLWLSLATLGGWSGNPYLTHWFSIMGGDEMLTIPFIWAWQIVWWLIGVVMIGWLAFKIGLSTFPPPNQQQIQPLNTDISESADPFCHAIYSNRYPANG